MARQSSNTRSWYLWALVALIAGLIVGLIIGWGIWPVTYKNTLPQDLRPAERDYYLGMVAESYAASGDLQLAQERLKLWPSEELGPALANLQERLTDTNPKLANDVQQLGAALSLGAVSPQPAPGQAQAAGGSPAWKTICTAGLWVLLLLGAILLLSYLFNRWRAARARKTGPAITSTSKIPTTSPSPEEIARQEKSEWPLDDASQPSSGTVPPAAAVSAGEERESYLYDQGKGPVGEPSVSASTREELPPSATTPPQPEQAAPRAVPPVDPARRTAAPAPATVPAAGTVGDYVAIYQMGEPDYDEAFDINDPVDGYMGQCGLQLNEPVGRNRDQAVALQAWLWDSSDPDTRTKVLMSEGAYRDTALRSQQAGDHEVLQVPVGTEFELESHDLLLRGRVDKVDYTDQEPYRGVFAELQVRMQVYRKS